MRLANLFFVFWVGIFIVSFFTASDEITFLQRLLFSGALALVAPALSLSGKKTKRESVGAKNTNKLNDVDVHAPLDPKVLYRVRSGKIYKGMAVAPTYEIKGDKIYPALSSKPVYQIKGEKVYHYLEPVPILEIKGNKIHRNLDSKVTYEITSPKGM